MSKTTIKLELKNIKIKKSRFLYFDNDPKLQGTIIKPPLPIPFGSVQKHNNYKFYVIIKNNEIEKLYATSINAKQQKVLTQIIPTFKKKKKIKVKEIGNIEILIWGVYTDIDRWNANRIISRCHYLPPPNNGYIIGCKFVNQNTQENIRELSLKNNKLDEWSEAWTEKSGNMIGCAVIDSLVYANPTGRRTIAVIEGEKELLKGRWHKADRKTVLNELAVAWCSRFAIDAPYRGYGIGEVLAKSLLTVAKSFRVPNAKYIEVITTQKSNEAKELVSGENESDDFLIKAGYSLVPDLRPSRPMISINPQTGKKTDILATKKLYYYCKCE